MPVEQDEASGTHGAATADVIAAYLEQAGIRHVFGYPGDPNIEFMEAARRRGLEVVLARREGTAAFMAEAFGMLTGLPGTCMSTLGPGSTALVNGVAAAYLDRVPMLALSGQIATAKEPYFTHQVVDHTLLFSPVTKWAGRIEPGAAATVMRKALRLATAERPGPVHLTAAADAIKAEATDAAVSVPPLRPAVTAPQVYRHDGADPLARLRAARRPVILAGIGAARAGATPELVRLAETAGVPVVVSPMAKGVVPEDHPYYAATVDMACNQVVWNFLAGADLIVAVGFDPVELIKPWSLTAPVLHVDTVPNVDQVYTADTELVGDVAALVGWLADAHRGGPRWSEAELAAFRARLRDAYYQGRVDGRLNPTDVVDAVRDAMPRDTIATSDVGSHKLLVGQGWTTYEPRTTLMTNGLSTMGFGLPAAIAAKVVHPDRPVVCITGDGGFAMVQGELRLAASLGVGVVVVVLSDGSLNRIELKQTAVGYPSTATRIDPTDLSRLAAAMDCDGERVDDPAALRKALDGAAGRTRPLVVDARIDPSQYQSQF